MTKILLYRAASAVATPVDYYYRIICPEQETVWNPDTLAMDALISLAFADSAMDADDDVRYCGSYLRIPATLPPGEYDIVYYAGTAATAAETDEPEGGYRFKWNGRHIYAPVEKLLSYN